MPVGSPATVLFRYSGQALSALPANATETAVLSTGVLQAALPGAFGQPGASPQPVKISGVMNVTAGTTVSAIVIRIRQGVGTGGAVVGAAMTNTIAAGNAENIPFEIEDVTGLIQAGTAYTVTVVQTAATGASTINTFSLEVSA